MNQPTSGLRHQPPPALADYSGPPNGDYVRYVDQLMEWSEKEHRRTGGFTLPTTPPGGPGAPPITQPAKPQDIVRQVTDMLEQSKTAPMGKKTGAVHRPAGAQGQSGPAMVSMKTLTILFGMVLLGLFIFKAELAPLAIVLWVVWNVRRLLRSANKK